MSGWHADDADKADDRRLFAVGVPLVGTQMKRTTPIIGHPQGMPLRGMKKNPTFSLKYLEICDRYSIFAVVNHKGMNGSRMSEQSFSDV